ncbi:MAG TPA: hypothetical protein DEB39_07660 [Planctomycetaceae bacterium]|nr:hypothetical protein [Planctomycetaceae bacterium]
MVEIQHGRKYSAASFGAATFQFYLQISNGDDPFCFLPICDTLINKLQLNRLRYLRVNKNTIELGGHPTIDSHVFPAN